MNNIAFYSLLPLGFLSTLLLCSCFSNGGPNPSDTYQTLMITMMAGTSAAFVLAVVQSKLLIASRARLICLSFALGAALPNVDRLLLYANLAIIITAVPALLATVYLAAQQSTEALKSIRS